MAAKCAWNGGQSLLEKVADLSTSIDEARGNKSDRQIIQEFKKGIISQIRQEVEINIEELPEQLPDILEELSFILDDDANLPEPDEIMSWFQTNLDVAEKLEKSMETEDLNKPSEEQQIKEEFDRDFMQQAFGISQNARNLFTGFANSVAVNSFIFSGKDHKHINKNSYDFDVAVRNAQKDLLKTIVQYIRDTYSTNGVVTDSTISKIVSRNNEEDYNDLLIILRGVNSEGKKKYVILNNATLRRVTKYFGNLFEKPENLDKLVSDIIDPNKNITADNKQKVQSKVNAYNSWILLNNFDKFFKKTFSDSININYNKTQFVPGRYSLTSKGTKLYSTWRTTDEIFLDKEINNVTQFIISSLPMLNYNGDKLSNQYLKFSDFTNLITAKIKHLQNLPVTYKDIANFSNVRQILNNLRAQTNDTTLKEVIKVISDPKIKSFHDLIIYSRENPEKYWRTIFYLLGNDNAYKTLGLGTNNNNENSSIHTFTTTDKNVIQTINRQLFNGNTSLANAIDNDGGDELNFLAYITQSIDSMYEAQYGQYYQGEDSDSDSIKVQSLQSTFITSRRRALTRNIQAINSQKRINYKQYKSDFNIVLNTTEYSEDKTKVDSVDFDLQVSKANTIHVKTDSLGKTYFSINNSPLDINTLSDDEMLKISQFVYHILGVNIASDNFLNAYADIKASNVQLVKGQCFTDMLTLSSSILAKMAIQNELIGQVDTKKELQEKINTVFNGASSDFKPGVNSLLGEIELISSNRLPLMKTLAEITAHLEHSLSSTQIKDGKGNAASVQTLSRLLGSYPYQWNDQSKIGAAQNFSIFGATFLGTEQMKEAKIGSNYKSHVDFNPLEFETAGIVYDYLLSRKNGKLRFIPAIMSDKSYIGRMLIDLNAKTKYLVKSGYKLENLSAEEYDIFYNDFANRLSQYLNQPIEKLLQEDLIAAITPNSVESICEKYGKSNINFNMWAKTILKENNIELPFTQYLEKTFNNQGNTLNEILSTISSDSLIKEIIYEELGSFYVRADSAIANTWESVNKALTEIGLPEVLGTDSETIAVTLQNANLPTDFDLNNFKQTNQQINTLRALGVTKLSPIDFTKEIVRIYNNLHPTNIIKLTENVHYENNKQNIYSIGDVKYKNNLGRNHTFEYLLEIFSDPKLTAGYFKQGEQSMLSDLLKDNFEIDIVGNPDLKAVIGIDSISKVNGKFILGNITINNNTYEITSDLAAKRIAIQAMQEISGNSSYVYSTFSKFLNDLTNLGVDYNIDLNQQLRNYNALDFLYSQEFINSTVGAHYAHPGKLKFKDYNNPTEQEILWEENARYAAQSKRNVSFPATMQEFQLGMLNGIPSKYNIAIISDAHDSVYNVNGDAGGDSGTANPHDGATFVNPFINYLENNSLGGASAGNIKKPFVHFYDEQTGTGGIIKTAGFPLTNHWIKDSHQYRNMMYNMTARQWFDRNGNFTTYNILKGFDVKHPNQVKNLSYKNPREQNQDGDNASFAYKENGQIYRVTNIEYLGNGSYFITRNLVDKYNQLKSTETIQVNNVNSNYALWNMFGGYNSLEWDGNKYIPSEYSIQAVVSAMNKVGEVIDLNISQIRYQDEVYQPLKYSDIHYMPTAGAVKQGMGNINNLNDVLHKQKPVNFFQINMNQAGIQLDKEHEADNEEISLMTQVVSSCIARGYSFDEASEMYQALAALARQGIKNSLNAYENILRNTSQIINNKEKFRDVIVNIIVDSIIHQDSKNSLVESIKQKLISLEQYNYKPTNNELAEMIPFSDAAIFNSLASQLSIDITKSAIKLKIDGVLSILCPAYDIMKIHGGKRYGQYESEEELQQAQEKMPILHNAIEARINNCYNVTFADGHTEAITIKRPGLSTYKDNGEVDDYGYMSFKNEIESGNIVSFQENIIEGRDLAHYNCIFNGVIQTKEDNLGQIEEHQYQLYDLASTQRLHYLHDNFNNSTLDKFREDLSTIIYFSEIMSDDEIVNYVDHLSDEEVYKELDKLYRRQLQKDLITITEGNGDVEIMTFEDLNGIDEGGHIVHVSNPAQVESAEVILPKYFKTNYGLTEEDELSEINEKGYKFFEEKIRHKISSRINPQFFDIEFKYNNGQHIYVADKLRKPTKQTDTFYKVKAEIRKIDNEYWRIDPETGEKMYRVNNKNDEIWITYTDAGTQQEVIITENPSDYIDILSGYSNIALSTEDYDGSDISNTRDIYFQKIINGKNKRLSKLFSKYINDKGIIDNSFYEEVNNPLIYGYTSSNELLNDHIEKQAKEMFSSFQKSLELVAARIPAQSMQSFMSMKIVAFDSTDSNTSYVASSQLFLQGSDFDIDTTNFTAYSVEKNGKIAHWSNLANFESKELLKASDKLPFPTGEVAQDYTQNDIYNKLDITGLILENEKRELILNTNSVENINLLARAIRVVNSDGLNKLYIGQAKTLSDRTKEFVKKIIDSHNVGFYKQNHKLVENATKNYMLTKMHDIIESPKNQIEAQTGIDVATKRVKDIANAEDNPVVLESKSQGVNNALTKMKGINNTQVGKKGVGICAVGMKSFFALQLYNDKVLNNPNSTPEQLHRLLLGPDGKGITIGGKTYTKLVNIYKKGQKLFRDQFDDLTEQQRINFVNSKIDELKRLPEGETKQNLSRQISGAVIDILTRSENDDDAAISLSALLSQATDNAKELSLGKINAGTNMLGMYIYGVAIGVPFEEVAKIIMSSTAKIVAGMMEGNIFNNQKSMTIQEVFDYFIYGPEQELYNFKKKDQLLDSNGNFLQHDKHESVTEKTNFPHSEAIYYVANKIEKLIDEHDEHPLADLISKLNFDKYSLNDQITFFESLKLHGDTSEYAMCINQVVDICENYITNKYNVLVEDKQNYEDLQTLTEGAEEFKVLGQLLHVNQGLETSLDRQMAYIDKFNLINTRLSTINRKRKRENKNSIEVEAYQISLDDFIQNPEKCIEMYEKIDGTNIKHTFNLLDVLHNDDHFNMYTRSAWLLDKELYEISSKYKTIKYWSPIVKQLLGKVQDNTVVKGLSRMYDTYVTSDWLLSHSFGPNNDQPLTIYLSDEEKQLIEGPFSKAGNIKLLGTDEGKAQYIAWIEKVVIPNLKQGINGLKNPDDSYSINYALKNNKFIQGLEMNLFTNTPTHQNTLAYSLPINMSPRSDDEKNALQEYKTAFNQLNNTAYGYYQTANGEIFNLQDLFFIYNLIAHYNAPGEKTLTNIFSDSNDYGLIKQYRDFEGKFNANEVITKDNISTNYVMAFCIPTSSISIAESKYAWTTSTNAFQPTLMVKQTKDEYQEEYEDDNIPREIPKRNFKGEKYVTAFNNELQAKPDTPDFPVNTNQITSSELVIDGKKYLFTIEHVNGRIIKLAYKQSDGYVINLVIDQSTNGSTLLNFDNLKNKLKLVPNFSLSSDGKIIEDWQLDLSKIQDLIENDINKCN